MPQVFDPKDGWIPLDDLAPPHQELEHSEVDAFLRYLFGDIARRPEPLTLSKTASVVRYLKWLSLRGVPSEVTREGVETKARDSTARASAEHRRAAWEANHIAEVIWGTLLQSGNIRAASKEEAIAFLRTHKSTYLAIPYIDGALEFVESFEIPSETTSPFRPPAFASRSRTVQSTSPNPRLKDDLSQRIYISDQALKRAKVRARRSLIARALEKAGVERGRPKSAGWTAEDVHERAKEFQNFEKKKVATGNFQQWSDGLVNQQVGFFKNHRAFFEGTQGTER